MGVTTTIRNILLNNTKLLTVVDFGSTEVFTGISAYIATIVVQKGKYPSTENTVRAIRVHDLPSRLIGARLHGADCAEISLSTEYLSAYDVPHPHSSASWLFLSPSSRQAKIQLEESSQSLDAIAGVYQGIRTGANDIFVVETPAETTGPLVKIRNGLGDEHLVERSLLHPVVFGSEIGRYDELNPTRYLIYPYHSGCVLPEQELGNQFPQMYAYLSVYRSMLSERRSITSSGLHWYELVRRRDETWLTSPKLLIRDLATRPSFALDQLGTILLVGGTAVVPANPSQLLTLLGYLNSAIVNWYLRQLTPSFKAGFQKFEPQHLENLPVVSEIIDQTPVSDQINDWVLQLLEAHRSRDIDTEAKLENQIDTLLSETTGINLLEVL